MMLMTMKPLGDNEENAEYSEELVSCLEVLHILVSSGKHASFAWPAELVVSRLYVTDVKCFHVFL